MKLAGRLGSPAGLRVFGGCVETFGGYAEASGKCADSESAEHAKTLVAFHREKTPLPYLLDELLVCRRDEPLSSHRGKMPPRLVYRPDERLVSRRVGHREELG